MSASHNASASARQNRIIAACLSLAVFAVYALTLAPDVLPGDSGEFQFAAPLLSIVHPTGYPLYLLLAKLFTLIPIGTVAYRVNLFSAACAALAVALLYDATWRALERSTPASARATNRWAALIAALTFAFTPTFWAQAIKAEVYALNALFVAALLGLALRGNAKASLALTLGLALTHHRSIILLTPALAAYLFPFAGWRGVWKRALVLLVLPLTLYFYTPLRYAETPYTRITLDDRHVITTIENTPAAFVAHALGTGFGGALRWDAVAVERLAGTPGRIVNEFGGGFVGWVALGMILLGTLQIARTRAWRLGLMLVTALLTYAVFNAAYHIGDIADFYTPIYLVCALLIGQGIAGLALYPIAKGDAVAAVWQARLLLAVFLPVPALLLAGNFTAMQSHEPARAQWQSLLSQEIPQGAALLSNDRDELTPLFYLQLVEHVRPDLVPLFPLIAPGLPHVVSLTHYALETQHPVYLIKPMDGLALKFRLQNEGRLMRVLGAQDLRPQHALVRDAAAVRFLGWTAPPEVTRGLEVVVALFWQARGASRPDFKTYVHLVNREGKTMTQSDHAPGGVFYPPSQWFVDDAVRDEHIVRLPADLARGEYRLVAGAYLPSGAIAGVARIELGTIVLMD